MVSDFVENEFKPEEVLPFLDLNLLKQLETTLTDRSQV
jgi:hypothetical protein